MNRLIFKLFVLLSISLNIQASECTVVLANVYGTYRTHAIDIIPHQRAAQLQEEILELELPRQQELALVYGVNRSRSPLRFLQSSLNHHLRFEIPLSDAVVNEMPAMLQLSNVLRMNHEDVIAFFVNKSQRKPSQLLSKFNQINFSELENLSTFFEVPKLNILELVNLELSEVIAYKSRIKNAADEFGNTATDFLLNLERNHISLQTFFNKVDYYASHRAARSVNGTNAFTYYFRRFIGLMETFTSNVSAHHNVMMDEFRVIGNNPNLTRSQRAIQYGRNLLTIPERELQQLYLNLVNRVRLTNIHNPGFDSTLKLAMIMNTFIMAAGHYTAHGLDNTDIYTAQLVAFTMLEYALTTMTNKDAAFLLANPELLRAMRSASRAVSLNQNERTAIKSAARGVFAKLNGMRRSAMDLAMRSPQTIRELMAQAPAATARYLRDVRDSAIPLGLAGFSITFFPFSAIAALDPEVRTLSTALEVGAFRALAAAAIVGISSNVRYNLFVTRVIPHINRNWSNPSYRRAAVVGIMGVNLFFGPYLTAPIISVFDELRERQHEKMIENYSEQLDE